jgi:hypothetical protein
MIFILSIRRRCTVLPEEARKVDARSWKSAAVPDVFCYRLPKREVPWSVSTVPDMLTILRRKLAKLAPEVQARVELVDGDMRAFSWTDTLV